MTDLDYGAELSAGLMMYGLPSSAVVPRDTIQVVWKEGYQPTYDSVFFIGDKYGSLVEDIFGKSLQEVGELKLFFARPQPHRRQQISIGHLFLSQDNKILFVNINKSSFEQAGYDFIEELLSNETGVKQWICFQAKSFNSSFLSRKAPPGILRIATSSPNSFVEPLLHFQELPQGFYLHSLAAACLNYSQTVKLPGVVLNYDADREDLPTTAKRIYDTIKAIAPSLVEEIPSTLNNDIFLAWRKRVRVDDTAHLYL